MKSILAIFLILIQLGHIVPGQSRGDTIRVSTDLVVIDAEVLNSRTGEFVGGLRAGDFTLYADDQRQEITHFSQDKLRLSVILLIDLSGSVTPALPEIREGALGALNRLKETDEVAVMAFSSTTELVQGFTRDRRLVVDRIGKIEKTPVIGQGTSLFQALSDATLEMDRAGIPVARRVIIAITDNIAWEYNFSGLTEKEVSQRVVDSGSMICGLIVEGALTRTEKIFLKNREGRDIYRRRMTIDPFVELSGGEIIKSNRSGLPAQLSKLVDHLRTRYSFGFSPKQNGGNGRFHRLRIELTDEARRRLGEVTIRTKRGYSL